MDMMWGRTLASGVGSLSYRPGGAEVYWRNRGQYRAGRAGARGQTEARRMPPAQVQAMPSGSSQFGRAMTPG
jgi:hypothetical protein